MKALLSNNKWIYSCLLYPLSWITYSGPNLSWLAWVAFVPLFIFLKENKTSLWRFYGSAFIITSTWTSVTSCWLFNFPMETWQVGMTVFSETMHISLPFFFLYFFQKLIGFDKALWLFPAIWVGWEWIYIPFQHTMATHLLPYGQGNNLWLIQMADFGGMWIVGLWVMMFNVAMYFALETNNFIWNSKAFAISAVNVMAVMILPVLLYGLFALNKWSDHTEGQLQVSIIPTQFESGYITAFKNQKDIIERTLYRTDSLAYDLINAGKGSDLYVWPETGTSYWMAFPNTTSLLMEATDDWSGALITGCTGIPVEGNDKQVYVTGVMLSPFMDSTTNRIQYHHKTSLSPGGETIPYREILEPYLDSSYVDRIHYAAGNSYEPLQLETKKGPTYTPGISLCYEQWSPKSWTKQVNKGADFFVHIAAEGWYGNIGFQQFMANVTRFRAVENRRSVARSSNKGLSMFINSTGKTYSALPSGSTGLSTADVQISSKVTWYSRYPDALPKGCLLVSLITILMGTFQFRKSIV